MGKGGFLIEKNVNLRLLARNLDIFGVSICDSGTDDMMSCMGMGLFKSLSKKKNSSPISHVNTHPAPRGFPPTFFLSTPGYDSEYQLHASELLNPLNSSYPKNIGLTYCLKWQ